MTTTILHDQRPTHTLPASFARCPICNDLGKEIACYLQRERELRAVLAEAPDGPNAEAIRFDLDYAMRHIDALIALGWAEARR